MWLGPSLYVVLKQGVMLSHREDIENVRIS